MDLVSSFVAGVLAISVVMWLRDRWKRNAPEETPPRTFPKSGGWVPAKVVGVYADVVTADGRTIKTGPPRAITIDCEMVTYLLPFEADFDAELVANVIHLGVETTTTSINPPWKIRKGQHVTVVQPVSTYLDPDAKSKPVPEWAR